MVIGIKEGPPKAAIGSLSLCEYECYFLSMQTSINFLIDFDAVEVPFGILVVGIDI